MDELTKLAKDGLDCFIALGGGLRSSKHIEYNGTHFVIFNEIDGTFDRLYPEEVENDSNIGYAIKNNSLIRW